MSYRANIDIAIALHTLNINSFRKQGYLRFKLTLTHRIHHTHTTHTVLYGTCSMLRRSPFAVRTIYTNNPTNQQYSIIIWIGRILYNWIDQIYNINSSTISSSSNHTSITTRSVTTQKYYNPNSQTSPIGYSNVYISGSISIPRISSIHTLLLGSSYSSDPIVTRYRYDNTALYPGCSLWGRGTSNKWFFSLFAHRIRLVRWICHIRTVSGDIDGVSVLGWVG